MLERITPGIDKFYVACGKTDMRMGINGLVNKITTEFKLEPCENSALLFCGIRKDRIKVLLWDGSRFILMYKRVERGSFKWQRNHTEAKQISVQQLEWLLTEISSVRPKNVLSNMSHLLPWSDKVPADCRSNNLEDLRQAETTSED